VDETCQQRGLYQGVTAECFRCGCEEEVDLSRKAYLVPYLPVTPTSVHCQLEILEFTGSCVNILFVRFVMAVRRE
jgi:hypothetical protein